MTTVPEGTLVEYSKCELWARPAGERVRIRTVQLCMADGASAAAEWRGTLELGQHWRSGGTALAGLEQSGACACEAEGTR